MDNLTRLYKHLMFYYYSIVRRIITQVILLTTACLGFIVLSVVLSQTAQAATATYAEDFSTNDYFNSSTSGELTKWMGGAQLMWDLDNQPAPFAFKSSSIVSRLTRSGNYIYSTYNFNNATTLQVFDADTFSYTTVDMSSWGITAQVHEMETLGTYLYITWGKASAADGGLAIVDISSPTNPSIIRNLNGIQHAHNLVKSGSYIYVVSGSPNTKLTVVDISTPSNPTVVDDINLSASLQHYDAVKWGNYVVIGRTAGSTGAPFTVIDVTTPSSIAEVTTTYPVSTDLAKAFDIDIKGDQIFVVGMNTGNAGDTYTYSLGTSSGDVTFSQIATDAPANDAVPQFIVKGTPYYYINGYNVANAQRDLFVYDVDLTGSGSITEKGNVIFDSSYGQDIAVYNNNLWMANPFLGLLKFDVSDPDNPGPSFSSATGSGEFLDVATVNTDELATAGGTGQSLFEVTDADDPAAMTTGSTQATSVSCEPNRLWHGNNYTYIACEDYYGYTNGVITGTTTWVDTSDIVNDVLAYNNTVYVLNENNDLTTWDATTNVQLDTDSVTGTPQSLTRYSNYLIIATGSSQIHVYDISTASNPSYVRSLALAGGNAHDVDVSGNIVYTVGSKLNIIDAEELVTNATSPTMSVSGDLGPIYRRGKFAGGYLHIGQNFNNSVSDDEYTIYNVKDPDNITEVTKTSGAGTDLAGGFESRDSWLFIADGATNGVQAVHHMYPVSQTIYSTEVDTVDSGNTITEVDFAFITDLNGGQIFYRVSNDNGSTWSPRFTATTNTTIGSHTFTSVGSQLRWMATIYSDSSISTTDGSFQNTPTITAVAMTYTYEASDSSDTTGPTTTAFPAGGSYTGPQSVEFMTSESPATVYYTTDGSAPTTSSAVYDAQDPLEITVNTVVKAFAVDGAGNAGATITETYVIGPDDDKDAPTAFADPTAAEVGLAEAPFGVNLYCEDAIDQNPQIRFTTDGNFPTTSSQLFIAPINIINDTELRFRCFDASGNGQVPIGNENYIFADTLSTDTTPPTTVAYPTSGTFPSAISVSLETSDDFDPTPIPYYTVNGDTPTTSSQKYEVPLTFNTDTTLKFFSTDASGNVESPTKIEHYIIGTDDTLLDDPPGPGEDPTRDPLYVVDTTPPTLEAEPPGGTYSTPQTVALVCIDYLDPNPTRYYTTTGTVVSSLIYTTPFKITTDTTLRAVCVDASGNSTDTITEEYIITNTEIDTTPPVTDLICPTSFDEGELSFTVTDDFDLRPTTYFTIDGATATTLAAFIFSNTWQITQTYTVNYFSQDASDNTEAAQTETCTVHDSSKIKVRAKDKKKKVGRVRIVNRKTKEVITRFKAFNSKGVNADIVNVNGIKRVAAINYQAGRQMKLFDLNGNRLGSKRISKKNLKKEIGAGNAIGKKKQGEVIVAKISDTNTPVFSAIAYTIKASTNTFRARASYSTADDLGKLPTSGFTIKINKKKKILIKPRKGKNKNPIMILKLTKKKNKYSFKRLK